MICIYQRYPLIPKELKQQSVYISQNVTQCTLKDLKLTPKAIIESSRKTSYMKLIITVLNQNKRPRLLLFQIFATL